MIGEDINTAKTVKDYLTSHQDTYEIRKDIRSVDVVKNYLDAHQYAYEIEEDGPFYEFILEKDNSKEIAIKCKSTANQRVRINVWMPIDKAIVEDRWYRLLDACNIINMIVNLRARLFPDGVGISVLIPECGVLVLEEMLREYLDEVFNYVPFDIIDKAINTDEDIYTSCSDSFIAEMMCQMDRNYPNRNDADGKTMKE